MVILNPGSLIPMIFVQVPMPWLQIFTSQAVWGILAGYFCCNYGYYTLLTTLPTYFRDVLKIQSEVHNMLYIVMSWGTRDIQFTNISPACKSDESQMAIGGVSSLCTP